ncbi:MAG: MBL fold metallo-hydrolase, partial [Myxococcales bacterium]|nr:MBL fold metallo-hydrolase [Myxococcales bacterium]
VTVVDPGPGSTLTTLIEGLKKLGHGVNDIEAVCLTHIHFDHAGATGELVAMNPDIRVYVHTVGARHMVSPERLLASAKRLYGADFDRLWGRFLPVPEENISALDGGESVQLPGRTLAVAYAPGHAKHHVSYLDELTGAAYTGDTAGCRVAPASYAFPPTPPPDIDVELWRQSIEVFRGWSPSVLVPTHFGWFEDVEDHLDSLERNLALVSKRVKASLDRGMTAEGGVEDFATWHRQRLEAEGDEEMVRAYLQGAPPDACWHGLARYWRKREELGPST